MKYFLLLISYFSLLTSYGQDSAMYFHKIYSWQGNHNGNTVMQLQDSGYVVAGVQKSQSFATTNKWNAFLLRTNKYGDTLWLKRYIEETLSTGFETFIKTTEGNYLAVGYAQDTVTYKYNCYLAKTDTSGNLLWAKQIGNETYYNSAEMVTETYDKGFLIVGHLNDTLNYWKFYIIKADSLGNRLWDKVIHPEYEVNNYFRDIVQTPDSGYVLAGTANLGDFSGNIYLMKLDKALNRLWDTLINFGGQEGETSIALTSNNGYILGTDVWNFGVVMKMNADRNILWQTDISPRNTSSSSVHVRITKDHKYIGTGYIYFYTLVNAIHLTKIDTDGTILWQRIYGNIANVQYGYDVQPTNDSGYIITGRREVSGGANVYLLKTNCMGFLAPPTAKFTTTITNNTVKFSNKSDSAGSYKWYFGDGDTLIYDNFWKGKPYIKPDVITHVYKNTGAYKVLLLAGACGEWDTVTAWVNINSVVPVVPSAVKPAGSLDDTFGSGGKVTTTTSRSCSPEAYSAAIQNDGKIVVVGSCANQNITLVQYKTDGNLDNTFGTSGKVIIGRVNLPTEIYMKGSSVAIQKDGKIVVAGFKQENYDSTKDFLVVRFNNNGTLDNSFGSGGMVTTNILIWDEGNSVAIQSDGKIVVAGTSSDGTNSYIALVRYNNNGSLDNTFGSAGKVTTVNGYGGGISVAIQPDGKIVVTGVGSINDTIGGGGFVLTRYNNNGSIDNTFGINGKVITEFSDYTDGGHSVTIQVDGKIVVAGYGGNNIGPFMGDFAIARYNSDGGLDPTFGSGGKVTTDFLNLDNTAYSVAIQTDGKIVVAGISGNDPNKDFAVARYNSDGSLDSTFNSDGKVTTDFANQSDVSRAVVIQKDGKIVVAGYTFVPLSGFDFAIARYIGCPLSFSQTFGFHKGDTVKVGYNIYTYGGTYIDTLLASNGCDSIVTTNLVLPTGINTADSESGQLAVAIYPNPSNDKLIIKTQNSEHGIFEMFDVAGRVILQNVIQNSQSSISISYFNQGIYFYKFTNKKGRIARGKIIIQ